MSQELERRGATPTIEESFRIAKGFAMSGYFPDAKTAEQAFVKIMAGAEMGLAPFQSMKGIDVIKGQTFLKPALLRGLLDNSDEYDYEIAWEDDACTVSIWKDGKHRGDSRFSMSDAEKAGLVQKENYQKFERNMLLERATSNAVRWYAPGLTLAPVYITGESAPEILPPHIEALDRQAAEREERNADPIDEEPIDPADVLLVQAREMLDATEEARQGHDVPFDVAAPAPAAETGLGTPQIAAEPAAPASGGLLNTLDDALRFVNTLEKEQLEALRALLRAATPITRRALSMELLDQRNGWDTSDVLEEIT